MNSSNQVDVTCHGKANNDGIYCSSLKSLLYDIDCLTKNISRLTGQRPQEESPISLNQHSNTVLRTKEALSNALDTLSKDDFTVCDVDDFTNDCNFDNFFERSTTATHNGATFAVPEPTPILSEELDLFSSPIFSRRNSMFHPISPDAAQNEPSIQADSAFSYPVPSNGIPSFPQVSQAQPQSQGSSMNEDGPEELANKNNSFRSYQAEQWTDRFEELCSFSRKNGHCQVPHSFAENPALARWVKRQRYQYKLKQDGKASTMTDERVEVLEKIGFVWDSHEASWEERKMELKVYKDIHGNCNVPSNYSKNKKLSVWVKRQRRQYKFFLAGKPSNMSRDRIDQLETLGFEWELRCRESKC